MQKETILENFLNIYTFHQFCTIKPSWFGLTIYSNGLGITVFISLSVFNCVIFLEKWKQQELKHLLCCYYRFIT